MKAAHLVETKAVDFFFFHQIKFVKKSTGYGAITVRARFGQPFF